MTWDILIRGGTLYDGSSRPGGRGDVAIADGRVAQIGRDLPADAKRVIDAAGLAVTPGFIDIKTHSDFTLPINPKAESKVRQGVTTEIIGHCGFSVAPCLPGKVQMLADYLSGGAPWLPFRETSFPDYLDTFPAVAVNAGMLVGHNTLRLMVLGLEDRAPSAAELDQMCGLLEEGLGAGALGLSTGLFTPPGSFAEPAAARFARDAGADRGRDLRSRAQQLGAHPVLGGCAGLDLTETAANRGQNNRCARRRARRRSDRAALRSPDRRQRCDPRADRLDIGGRHPHDRPLAEGAAPTAIALPI